MTRRDHHSYGGFTQDELRLEPAQETAAGFAFEEPDMAKKPMGRPSAYSTKIADIICNRLADGMSLREICRADDMPDRSTVMEWVWDGRHEEFSRRYARAREVQADYLADDIIEIADRDDLDPNDKRARIDARKWLAGKLRPKAYGEKITQEVTGADGAPLVPTLNVTIGSGS